MECVRDRFWLWGHEAGSHNGRFGLSGESFMTPAAGAAYMGIPNVIMVAFGGEPRPPLEPHARALSSLKRLVWSIVGDSSSTRNDEQSDLEEVIALAERQPNITGAIMDDFFHGASDVDGNVGRYGPEDLHCFARRLRDASRPLDLWVVLYSHQLDLPVSNHLEQCDGVTFWRWKAEDLGDLEVNFRRLESLAPTARKMLGCYMWDYGSSKPMPVERMARQCETALQWLREGRVEGVIFLASCICDLGLDAVEWTKDWIAQVGEIPLRA